MNKPRLIDANELIKCIEYWYESCSPRTDLRDMVICDTLDSVLQHIDDIPTAYDIDKVIKELINNTQECTDRITYETHSFVPLFDAIKIVKGGAE